MKITTSHVQGLVFYKISTKVLDKRQDVANILAKLALTGSNYDHQHKKAGENTQNSANP
jgi:hypothetical protein